MRAMLSSSTNCPVSFAPAGAQNCTECGKIDLRRRRSLLRAALCVAALANAVVPALLFSNKNLFGHTDPIHRALIALVVIGEYAIAFLLLRLHANESFATGYATATASIVTLASALLAFLTVRTAIWNWEAPFAQFLVVAGFAFAVVSNAIFLIASVEYAYVLHRRLHLVGFALGLAASVGLVFLCARVFS